MFTTVNVPIENANPAIVLTGCHPPQCLFTIRIKQERRHLYDASIQNKPLVYSENTISGYLKMNLASPQYAFGNDLYPKIVAQVALVNADLLFKPKSTTLFESAVPKISPLPSNLAALYQLNDGIHWYYTCPCKCNTKCDTCIAHRTNASEAKKF